MQNTNLHTFNLSINSNDYSNITLKSLISILNEEFAIYDKCVFICTSECTGEIVDLNSSFTSDEPTYNITLEDLLDLAPYFSKLSPLYFSGIKCN